MTRFFAGFVVGIIALLLAAFLYIWFGFFPVATSGSPLPLERTIAKIALNAKVSKAASASSPVRPTEANLLAGATIYSQNCEMCHGLPSQSKSAIAQGMYPSPPQLFHGKGVTDDPVGETYWKISNGIRLTGMPGFVDSLSEEQRWQVSELLKNADQLPATVKQQLALPEPARVQGSP
jgi:thiosulfate dehydrogenase